MRNSEFEIRNEFVQLGFEVIAPNFWKIARGVNKQFLLHEVGVRPPRLSGFFFATFFFVKKKVDNNYKLCSFIHFFKSFLIWLAGVAFVKPWVLTPPTLTVNDLFIPTTKPFLSRTGPPEQPGFEGEE